MTVLRVALLAAALLVALPSAAEPPPAEAAPPPPAAPAATPPAAPAAPAAAPQPAGTRVGVGVGIATGSSVPVLYVPFDTRSVRFELDGSYRKAGTSDASITASSVGLGLFVLSDVQPSVRATTGLRVQYVRDDVSFGDSSGTGEAVRLAFVVGGEWAPVPAFSIGVEGQAGYSAGLGEAVSALDVSAQAIVRVFLTKGKTSGTTPAAAQQPSAPGRLKKCERTSDCEVREICFDGYCRR